MGVCPPDRAGRRAGDDNEEYDLEEDEIDNNLYSLGHIGDHNIVIVCLPAGLIGNNLAAAVATQMRLLSDRYDSD